MNFLDARMRQLGASGASLTSSSLRAIALLCRMVWLVTRSFKRGKPWPWTLAATTITMLVIWRGQFMWGKWQMKSGKIYDIVLRSNQALIEAAKAGLSRIDFDRIPRQIINDAGYGPYFSHGIGHGDWFGISMKFLTLASQKSQSRLAWSWPMSRVFIWMENTGCVSRMISWLRIQVANYWPLLQRN